ncbi:type II toxin-antitoxin system VapC family toxin [Allosalinactinospora lopnorensis]|uniref:type II toxin-antitoxin system VapC family toxin n=1 Tax=Allosalinactinospora lopnorensis TaxID=1352348 RepID=UPI000623E54C|nr:type II toxin-antitoxin system VapC family toxin [Allosalinactinospora lopnorensis]
MTDSAQVSRGLLDTSVIVDFQALGDRLPDEFAISAITLAELSAGLHTTNDPLKRAQRQLRLQWIESTFAPLPFDTEAARAYGSVAALVLAAGRKPRKRVADLQIASISITHGFPLYTRNPEDFKGLEAFLDVVAL